MYYRVLKRLGRSRQIIQEGCLTTLDWLSPGDIKRLESVGAVSKVHGPPLSEIPGWSHRAIRLKPAGIERAEEFLLAENEVIIKHMRVKDSTVERWRKELLEWLTVPKERRR